MFLNKLLIFLIFCAIIIKNLELLVEIGRNIVNHARGTNEEALRCKIGRN
jgi:hypothetical protein